MQPHDEGHQDFYRRIRKRIVRWFERKGHRHRWGEYVLLAPDVFYTLVKLMRDPDVPRGKKAKLAFAIAYFIFPFDLLPEAFVGTAGYLDDLVLAAYVLSDLLNDVPASVVRQYWPGESDVLIVIQDVVDRASDLVGPGLAKRLRRRVRRRRFLRLRRSRRGPSTPSGN